MCNIDFKKFLNQKWINNYSDIPTNISFWTFQITVQDLNSVPVHADVFNYLKKNKLIKIWSILFK